MGNFSCCLYEKPRNIDSNCDTIEITHQVFKFGKLNSNKSILIDKSRSKPNNFKVKNQNFVNISFIPDYFTNDHSKVLIGKNSEKKQNLVKYFSLHIKINSKNISVNKNAILSKCKSFSYFKKLLRDEFQDVVKHEKFKNKLINNFEINKTKRFNRSFRKENLKLDIENIYYDKVYSSNVIQNEITSDTDNHEKGVEYKILDFSAFNNDDIKIDSIISFSNDNNCKKLDDNINSNKKIIDTNGFKKNKSKNFNNKNLQIKRSENDKIFDNIKKNNVSKNDEINLSKKNVTSKDKIKTSIEKISVYKKIEKKNIYSNKSENSNIKEKIINNVQKIKEKSEKSTLYRNTSITNSEFQNKVNQKKTRRESVSSFEQKNYKIYFNLRILPNLNSKNDTNPINKSFSIKDNANKNLLRKNFNLLPPKYSVMKQKKKLNLGNCVSSSLSLNKAINM